jgi:predicted MFS family arabinose efflux permease
LAGVLIDEASYRAAFVGLAVLPLATLLATVLVPLEVRTPSDSANATATAPRKAWDLLANADLRRLLFINWLIAACWDAHAFALPVLGHQRGLSASAIATVLACYAVASAAVRLVIPFMAERLQARRIMILALSLTATVFLLYPWLHSAWVMAACAATIGIGLGAIQPAVMSSLHAHAPAERQGEALGLRSTVIHFSTLVMPLTFGAVGAGIGVAPVFWITGVALCAGAWAAFGLPGHNK